MIHYKRSKRAVISTTSTVTQNGKSDDDLKTLDNIKYLNDKVMEATARK